MYGSPLFFLAAVLALLSPLFAQNPAPQGAPTPVLIGFQQTPGAAEQNLVRAFGGTVKYRYTLVPGIAATVPQAGIQGLQNHPLVTIVEPDGMFYAIDAELDNTWGVKHIGAGTAHTAGNVGNGQRVCVLDSGIAPTHEDLFSNYVGGYDYVNQDGEPWDDNGHGTHVAGTIAALMNGFGVRGTAPSAHLLVYKVLSASGSGSFSDVIAALQQCVTDGGKITNNSYGSSLNPGSLVEAAFDNSYAAGVLHVAAAGNSGNPRGNGNNVGFPARYSSVIAVAATDQNDARARFSSTGPDVELAAPGVNIRSTYPPNTYADASGTSMASPNVAGVAALVRDCGITIVTEIRQRLQQTAKNLGSSNHFGYGLVQAADAALNCTAPEPYLDIAVKSVTAPETVAREQTATIEVVVGNVGTLDASDVSVTLTRTFDASTVEVGTQTISLAAGAQATLTFTWTTESTTPLGDHTLTASHSLSDANPENDSALTTIKVVEPPPSNGIVLDANGYKVRGLQKADLSWTGATAVTVFRNGASIANPSSSPYTDHIDERGSGTYVYKVCNTDGCSNEVTVIF